MRSDILRRTYGFDEISLTVGEATCDISLCSVAVELGSLSLSSPILASAMDSVVSPKSAAGMGSQGVLGVLNLHGLWTRYADAESKLQEIASSADLEFVGLMQRLYSQPIDYDLVGRRIVEMKQGCQVVAVSSIPQEANRMQTIAAEAGADLFVVQSTVTSPRHISPNKDSTLDIQALCRNASIPIIAGNCVSYSVALELMNLGVVGVLVGIGPGAACTSRGVLGVGVPMATAIMDVAAARDEYLVRSGRRVSVIADGGIVTSGDICKAIACGADAVMIGSPLAKADEAPGRGYHWGMATPSPILPRGTRIKVGSIGSYKQIINGPATLDNGFHNLIGALKTSMATVGATTIQEMQQTEVIVAPSILTEGKVYQQAQRLGMGAR